MGCSKLRARDQLNKGVTAYKNAKYEEAIDHFQQSVALDPSLINAKMYLATAFAQQYIPGADTPDNNKMAEQAIEQYQQVLDMNAARDQKVNSAKGIAYLYLNMKKFDEAKKYYRMAGDLDPNDPEPYYSVGVIDWTACYQPRMEERAKLGMKPDENLNPKNKDQKKVCAELKEKNGPSISGRHRQSEQGDPAPSRLRRRHGLPEPDVPREGRRGMRRPRRPPGRSEDRRPLGRSDPDHQESQGREAARSAGHHHGPAEMSFAGSFFPGVAQLDCKLAK